MENLKRYELQEDPYTGNADIEQCANGEWVKFEDIKEFLPSASHNSENTQGCVVCGCTISLKGYCAGCQTRI